MWLPTPSPLLLPQSWAWVAITNMHTDLGNLPSSQTHNPPKKTNKKTKQTTTTKTTHIPVVCVVIAANMKTYTTSPRPNTHTQSPHLWHRLLQQKIPLVLCDTVSHIPPPPAWVVTVTHKKSPPFTVTTNFLLRISSQPTPNLWGMVVIATNTIRPTWHTCARAGTPSSSVPGVVGVTDTARSASEGPTQLRPHPWHMFPALTFLLWQHVLGESLEEPGTWPLPYLRKLLTISKSAIGNL